MLWSKIKQDKKQKTLEEVTVEQQYEWRVWNRWLSESKACQTERKSSSKTSRYNKQASESAVEWARESRRRCGWRVKLEPFYIWLPREQFAIIRTVIKSHTGCLWAVRQICYKIQCPPPTLLLWSDLEYAMSLISFFLRDSQSQEYITHSETFTVKCPFIHVKLICHGIPLHNTFVNFKIYWNRVIQKSTPSVGFFPLHLWLCA